MHTYHYKETIIFQILVICIFSGLFTGCNTDQNKIANTSQIKSNDSTIDIPYQKFILDNGLTLIVHEDHKAPIVAVNVWYHVGSKNEKAGKTGFAHLFEHLMFNGSEHYDDDYFIPLEKVGATDLNGTTSSDRTNYFETVPKSALDVTLWMESDRMGHLLGAITQEKLDEQRGVVQNEKRQGENRPYGQVYNLLTENTYPAGHPYSWTVIGSMEDLDAASLEDVHQWFKTYYGAANAVLSICGDVDTQQVKKKVEEYFGDIPSGPPVAHHQAWIAKRTGEHRQQLEDRVPQSLLLMVYNTPQWGSADADYLDLAADIFGSGKTSRLYKRLVYTDQIATQASASAYAQEIAGQFTISVMAKPGQDLAVIEATVREELDKFLTDGPTEKELALVKTRAEAGFIRGVERVGGFGGKSDILARNEVFGGSPDFYKVSFERMKNATVQDVKHVANDWLNDGVYSLEVLPFGEYTTKQTEIDRSAVPEPGIVPKAEFPQFQKARLSNGLDIIFAKRDSVPVVIFNMIINAGFSVDTLDTAGTASLAFDMMDEGTKTRTSLQISEEISMLGARLGLGSSLDTSTVYLSALKSRLDESLEIYADVILNPSFSDSEFKRLQKERLADIQQEKANPMSMGSRVVGKLLYGQGHAYDIPFSGSGTIESIDKMTTDDLRKFHATWIKPNNATLVIVGDTSLAEITPKLEKLFKNWSPGNIPNISIDPVAPPQKSTVYLMDRPDAEQSVLFTGQLIEPKSSPDDLAIATLIDILGGTFTSRINMNLREDKHWTYGARSRVTDTMIQRPLITSTQIQTDKTKESLLEILKEYRDIKDGRPPSQEELSKIQDNETLGLAGRWETMSAVSGSIENIVTFNLPDDYYKTYADKINSLTVDKITDIAQKTLLPEQQTWLIVGDLAKIENDIKQLGLGEVKVIDPDGNIIR